MLSGRSNGEVEVEGSNLVEVSTIGRGGRVARIRIIESGERIIKEAGGRKGAEGIASPPDSPPSVRESSGLLAEHTARKHRPQGVEFAGGVCYVPSQNICTKVNPLQIFVRSLSYFVRCFSTILVTLVTIVGNHLFFLPYI